ncbi:hypothetical protein ACQ4PT_025121 [Festuca glaucescens]
MGAFSPELNPYGVTSVHVRPQLEAWNGTMSYWTNGNWTGHGFTVVPEFVGDMMGRVQFLAWVESAVLWMLFWSEPKAEHMVCLSCSASTARPGPRRRQRLRRGAARGHVPHRAPAAERSAPPPMADAPLGHRRQRIHDSTAEHMVCLSCSTSMARPAAAPPALSRRRAATRGTAARWVASCAMRPWTPSRPFS